MIATIILIALRLLGLGVAFGKNGEKQTIKFWEEFISTVIIFILYYYAGLFNNFN